jgi:hypothetical protein
MSRSVRPTGVVPIGGRESLVIFVPFPAPPSRRAWRAVAQIAAGYRLAGVLPAPGAGAPRVGGGVRESAQELPLEREHPFRVCSERRLAAPEQRVVPGLVQVGELAAEVVVGELVGGDPV